VSVQEKEGGEWKPNLTLTVFKQSFDKTPVVPLTNSLNAIFYGQYNGIVVF